MALDLQDGERLYSLTEIIPRLPISRTYSSVVVWARRGFVVNGRTIKLKTMMVAGRMHTTDRWVRQFLQEQQEQQEHGQKSDD